MAIINDAALNLHDDFLRVPARGAYRGAIDYAYRHNPPATICVYRPVKASSTTDDLVIHTVVTYPGLVGLVKLAYTIFLLERSKAVWGRRRVYPDQLFLSKGVSHHDDAVPSQYPAGPVKI